MCGIAGVLEPDGTPDPDEVRRMLDVIAHRGPDGSGCWADGPVVLGHVRLAILDLSDAAAQPMPSSTGRLVVSYNGEVFNFPSLRAELGETPLSSTGDTAVVVEYVERFGIERFVERAEGFFALAIWDTAARTLTLARDRHGIKPLYVRRRGAEVRFASEMMALSDGGTVDPLVMASMLAGWSATVGTRTAFREITAVRPGEVVTFDEAGGVERERLVRPADFYDPELAARLRSADDEELVSAFDAGFRESIRLRMTSDAPVACLASGGIDSSLVAVIAKQEGFDLPLYHADVVARSERPAAEALARHLGADLVVQPADDEAIVGALTAVTRFNELPLTYHLNAIPFYLVAGRVSVDGVKVLLTGEGSDEYLLGYPQYGIQWAIGLLDRVRGPLRRRVRSATASAADSIWFDPATSLNSKVIDLLTGQERDLLALDQPDLSAAPRADQVSAQQSLELVHGHLVSLLHRNDRLGMAWGLESRFPFLGHELARVCLSGPAHLRLRRTRHVGDRRHPFVVDKWVVREAARRHLPVELVERPKMGFPVSIWNRTEVRVDQLYGGAFADLFGLRDDQLDAFAASAGSELLLRALLVETWMRVCVERQSIDDVQSYVESALVFT
jgi:asparagine synthase (glutamine-hydrolysing)